MSVTSDSPSKVDSDETGEKLFVCPSPGCNQRFENANSLAVHKQKHQMTLTLGPSKITSLADVLPVDQTPTPTRFLHLGNQIGLFDELNPFDREFKTAQKDGITSKQRRAAAVVQQLQLQALNNKTKSPSTPTRNPATTSADGSSYSMPGPPVHVITITPTMPSPVTALSGAAGQFFVPSLLPSPQGLIPALPGLGATSPMQVPANILSPTLMPFPSGFIPGMSASLMADAQQRAAAFTHAMFAAAASASSPLLTNTSFSLTASQPAETTSTTSDVSEPNPNTISSNQLHRNGSVPLPMMVLPKQERPLSVSSDTNFPDMTNSATLPQQNQPNLQSNQAFNQGSSDNIASSYPVMVQLPNGQTTCVGISSTSATMTHSSIGTMMTSNQSTMSNMNLNQSIMNSQSGSMTHPPLAHRASGEFGSTSSLLDAKQKLKETLKSNNPNLQHAVATSQNSTEENKEQKPAPRRRGRQSQDVDPDIKRQRFLERNRAAASRCRSKKKIWVNGLENKAKGLSQTNIMLQNEIAALKDEIASLKQLLLSHRDCPITKMQQQNMAFAGLNIDLSSTSTSLSNSVKAELSASGEHLHQTLTSTLSNSSMDGSSSHSTQHLPSVNQVPLSSTNSSIIFNLSSSTESS